MSEKVKSTAKVNDAAGSDAPSLSAIQSWWRKYHNHVYGLSSVIGLVVTFVFFFIEPKPPDPAPSPPTPSPEVETSPSDSSPILVDEKVSSVAKEILAKVENADAVIGVFRWKWQGTGLSSPVLAKDWVRTARAEANIQILSGGDQERLIRNLSRNKFGYEWMIQFGEQDPITLEGWIRENVDFPNSDNSDAPASE